MHTTASDGMYAPASLVRKAKDAGLKTIAITDHDTLSGIGEAQAAGRELGVRVIAGVEISTKYRGHNVHVLGYNMARPEYLHEQLASIRNDRELREADRRKVQRARNAANAR